MELYNEKKLVWIPGYGRHNTKSKISYNTLEEVVEAYNNHKTTEFDFKKLTKEANKTLKEFKDKEIRGCCSITIEHRNPKKNRYDLRMGLKTSESGKKHITLLKDEGESEQIRHLNFPYLYNAEYDSDHTKTVKGKLIIDGKVYTRELKIASISCVPQEVYNKYYSHIVMVDKEEFEKANWN